MLRTAFVAVFLVFAALARPAAADDISADYKGLKVNATLTMADGKTMADGIVLLLHGTLAHHKMEMIAAAQELLAERGISSLAPSLSYGLNDRKGMYAKGVAHKHRNEGALDEIAFWLDYLKGKGAGDITLAGHSRGGMQVSWFMAERGDDAVKRVVLIASGQWNPKKAAKGFKRSHKADLADMLAKAKGMDGDAMMKGVGVLYYPGEDVAAKTFISYYEDNPNRDSVTTMQKIKQPVLAVVGTKDNIAAGLIDRVKAIADGKKITLVEVEDSDHFFIDFYGEDLADAMQNFIEGGES